MAHGFITPTSVSGDNFWQNVKDLMNLLDKLKKRKAPPEEVVPAVVSELQNALPPGKERLLSSGKQQSDDKPKALNMLKGSPVAKMLGSGKSEITIKQQLALPPGGPKLPPGVSPSGKGGTFTNLPGISAAPKKLDSEAFFKAAQTGVDPQTGEYLSPQQRKDYLKKSKATMNAPASIASAGAAGISSIGEVTRGDEQIIGSVKDLTKIVVSLVNAVKAQTAAQVKAANAQKASTERTANRALAAAEEGSLEQSADLSGTITPAGGIGSMTPGSGGAGGGGGLLSAAGGMIAGKAAQAVTKRGLGRALPRIGASIAGKTGARAGAQATAKVGTNVAAKTGGKALARMVPGVQTALGVGFAMDSFSKGDVLGGLLNLGSAIPGPLGWAFLGGSVANDLSKDGGVAPFADGGIISSPTLSLMGENSKKEGVFPLEGAAGKKTFEMFGQGMLDAQKKNRRDYAQIQAMGLRQYYENEGGGEKLGKSLASIWGKVNGVLGSLFSGTLNSLMGPANATELNPAADYLNAAGGTQDMMTLATIASLESGSAQGQADVAQSVYNRLADKKYGSSITDILTRQGQYQVAFKDPKATSGAGTVVADEFKNIKTEDDAVKAIMYYHKKRGQQITEEQARKKIRGSVSAIQNVELQQRAAAHVQGRTEFRGYDTGRSEQVHRGGGSDNYFVSQYGSGNQMKRGAAAIPMGLFEQSFATGAGTGGSKLESDILAFRQARTKFGVSANRQATDNSFNLAIRELRGSAGGSTINSLADDLSYQDVHQGEAHKKGYGFDVPIGSKEQAQFVVQFFKSRGYETIYGADDPTGKHNHHVHVQAPKAKAAEFMRVARAATSKPKPKGQAPTATADPNRNANLGTEILAKSTEVAMTAATQAGQTIVNNVVSTPQNAARSVVGAVSAAASMLDMGAFYKKSRR